MINNIKIKLLVQKFSLSGEIYPPPANSAKFGENVKNPIIQRNVNFVGEHSSRAYFIDIVLLIKNRIGTMPLKFLVFILRGGGILKEALHLTPRL